MLFFLRMTKSFKKMIYENGLVCHNYGQISSTAYLQNAIKHKRAVLSDDKTARFLPVTTYCDFINSFL